MKGIDKPKLLRDGEACRERLAQINEPHVESLTQFVEELRKRKGLGKEIPYFDPWDGGINAKVLYLLEAPGKGAVYSGFISRNNPDESAKNTFEISQEAGLDRKQTVIWNIVPWYIGDKNRIRCAKAADINEGLEELCKVLNLLNVSCILLMGGKAQKVKEPLKYMYPNIKRFFNSYHPSPQFVNRSPENRGKILSVLQKVREFIQQNDAR